MKSNFTPKMLPAIPANTKRSMWRSPRMFRHSVKIRSFSMLNARMKTNLTSSGARQSAMIRSRCINMNWSSPPTPMMTAWSRRYSARLTLSRPQRRAFQQYRTALISPPSINFPGTLKHLIFSAMSPEGKLRSSAMIPGHRPAVSRVIPKQLWTAPGKLR